jgi:spoIIIJ-associated protein
MTESETFTKSKAFLAELLGKMGLDAQVEASETEERVTLVVKGEETSLVIGKKGQTLDAIQYLVNKMSSHGKPEGSGKPVQVDSEGYRDRRAEVLVELAGKLADKCRKTGRPVEMDPMSPAERRVVHVALANEADLETRSEGEGIYRHLVIFPKSGDAKKPAEETT